MRKSLVFGLSMLVSICGPLSPWRLSPRALLRRRWYGRLFQLFGSRRWHRHRHRRLRYWHRPGLAVKSSVEGIARNPEASGKITVTMLIGLAMIESLCIYALVVALIILYAYPMAKPLAAALGLKV